LSPDTGGPESEAGPWPADHAASGRPPPNLSLVVGRDLGTVVVTVGGQLSPSGCELLQSVLTDLIEGQGNLTVAVDVGNAIVEPDALLVFIDAARRARRHGARFVVKEPPTGTREALQSSGFDDLVEVLPRRASSG
jgi:anti-anti-sigma regulatory factor